MPSDLYWIDTIEAPRLAIMARPRAGDWLEDEIAYWVLSGVQIVVSLLEQHEIEDLGLEMEAAACEAAGIQYLSFPIPDRGLPGDIDDTVDFVRAIINQDKAIAIHCRAGIGRSSVMAAAVLVGRGLEPAKALSMIQQARGLQIPDTDAQRAWVLNLGGGDPLKAPV